MARQAIIDQVEQMARSVAARRGLEVADVELLGEGPRTVLRVYIESPQGVSVEECAEVSEALSRQLDLQDLIPHSYTLEVSSPGLDRPLKRDQDFQRFAGREVEVRTYGPVDGQRHFTGKLMGLIDGRVTIYADGKTVRIPREQISQARLVVNPEELKEDLARGRSEHA